MRTSPSTNVDLAARLQRDGVLHYRLIESENPEFADEME
jgi:hypothetical protein